MRQVLRACGDELFVIGCGEGNEPHAAREPSERHGCVETAPHAVRFPHRILRSHAPADMLVSLRWSLARFPRTKSGSFESVFPATTAPRDNTSPLSHRERGGREGSARSVERSLRRSLGDMLADRGSVPYRDPVPSPHPPTREPQDNQLVALTKNEQLGEWNCQLLRSGGGPLFPLPFKGRAGVGMVLLLTPKPRSQHHPHPNPPLEGEGFKAASRPVWFRGTSRQPGNCIDLSRGRGVHGETGTGMRLLRGLA
jgi:hypothetical protein